MVMTRLTRAWVCYRRGFCDKTFDIHFEDHEDKKKADSFQSEIWHDSYSKSPSSRYMAAAERETDPLLTPVWGACWLARVLARCGPAAW